MGFAVALVVLKHQADAQQVASAGTISEFSNQIVKANISIEDLNQANLNLRSDLATNREMSLAFSNQLAETAGTLASTASSLQSAQQQITNLNDAHRRFGGPEPGARPARQFALQHHRLAGHANHIHADEARRVPNQQRISRQRIETAGRPKGRTGAQVQRSGRGAGAGQEIAGRPVHRPAARMDARRR